VLGVTHAWAADTGSIRSSALEGARLDLISGRADEAIKLLNSSLAADSADAEAHYLLCRVLYQEERWEDAVRECEAAVRLAPNNSGYHLWLGRAYGQKANNVNSFSAYGLAKRVRAEFERAVQLDSGNVDAMSDLGEFYIAAPEIVGGDKNKALSMVKALEQHEPAQAHRLRGLLAEKEKNYSFAEAEFKAAVGVSRDPASAGISLAAFYSRQRQWDQMLRAVREAIAADAKSQAPHSSALVDGATILSHANRELQLAIDLLKLYLASPNQSADAPAFQVHAQLAQLLEQQGDKAGARQQFAAANALARDYHPGPP
jgi:tetratricopeptide (TPR) repeat protein